MYPAINTAIVLWLGSWRDLGSILDSDTALQCAFVKSVNFPVPQFHRQWSVGFF